MKCAHGLSPLSKSYCQKFTESCLCLAPDIPHVESEQYVEINLPVAELSSGSESFERVNLCSKPTPVE
ncbi:hypothetical protein T10_13016 [Trichinella papuae]|uniref:Uncharacterized protein n=1 Tax=Trichinella papuae TaxID=268474 RepID=A0A0V1MYM6_9BILA|nr:hypothetical protein T10_13016 [Trichinella papuae]